MEKKYINESRYKKSTTRKRRDARTVKSNLRPKQQTKVQNLENSTVKNKINVKSKTKKKVKKYKKRKKENKLANIITCIFLLVGIASLSRAILKDENEPFIYFPFMEKANEETIKIGVITSDSLLSLDTNNLVLNELNQYSKDALLEINEDYSITYKCISNVKKISNKEYLLTKSNEVKIEIEKIKEQLVSCSLNEKSPFYSKLKNISDVVVLDDVTLKVTLKEEDAYFVYNLDVCLPTAYSKTNYVQDVTSTGNRLILNRHSKANKELPERIVVIKYSDMYAAAQAYKDKEIDIFITDAENVKNILGRYEYNITTYRNGNCIFLFGNPESEVYSLKEVRQAIAYSIDRDGIIKDLLKSKGDKIDLPYIYDKVKYKYDVYAAENILLSNKYIKNNKVYSKTENGKKIALELDLIVNKNDDIKVDIANYIKNNLSAVGIKINVEKLTQNKMTDRIKKGNYDLCLASVYLNNNPDISFVENNLYITDEVKALTNIIQKTEVEDLNTNIQTLIDLLSQEISAIGIYSDISYVIYSKDIVGLEQKSYMNLFEQILK